MVWRAHTGPAGQDCCKAALRLVARGSRSLLQKAGGRYKLRTGVQLHHFLPYGHHLGDVFDDQKRYRDQNVERDLEEFRRRTGKIDKGLHLSELVLAFMVSVGAYDLPVDLA